MSIRPVDITVVQRMQDVSQIKQHENERPIIQQHNIGNKVQKEVHRRNEQVIKKDDVEKQNQKFDAKEKSQNEYLGNKKKKDSEDESKERVVIKGQKNFDIKI